MAKTPTQIASLARSHTEAALNVLTSIMNQPAASDSARVAAANSVLDRGWGKPEQSTKIGGDKDNPLEIVSASKEQRDAAVAAALAAKP